MSARRRSGPGGRVVALALGLSILPGLARLAPAARAPDPPAARDPEAGYAVGAVLSRGAVKLGEPVLYRGWITGGRPGQVRFLPPDSGGAFTWGGLRARVRPPWGKGAEAEGSARVTFADIDTVFVETTVQSFTAGDLAMPGLAFEVDDGSGPRGGRLPVTRLVVVPMLTAADTSADLRPLRGPLGAPWWERVPWTRVALAAVLIAALAAAVQFFRRRKPVPVAAPVTARTPASQALAELEALRRIDLPSRGRFAEHAFQLGRIVRRFLEAVAGTPLPGDTTPEFVSHLEAAFLEDADLERIAALMRFWDRVKFARAEESVEEAVRAEQSVEALVRRLGPRGAPSEPGGAAPSRRAA